jgi:hypothetical protein
MTVFSINAATFTHLLIKISRVRNGDKIFWFKLSFLGPLNKYVFGGLLRPKCPNQSIFLRGDFSKVSSRLQQHLLI